MKLNKAFSQKIFFMFALAVCLPVTLFAQAEGGDDLGKIFHLGVFIFFLFVFAILIGLVAYHNRKDEEMPTLVKGWRRLSTRMTLAAPVEKEDSILLDHDFDGIKELDNVLPPWWKYLFYATIVFSGIYLLNYHILNVWQLSGGEYNEEVKIAVAQRAELMGSGAFITEKNVMVESDAASLAAGAEVYNKNCAACHAANGAGLVGPNLTDDYWIHGGGIQNIFKVISNGVIEKGMLSWKAQLKPKQIQQVASYIISLKGSNPPNAKAPQGEKWIEAVSDSTGQQGAAPKK